MNPIARGKAAKPGDVDRAKLKLTSRAPGAKSDFPARSIVDAGFLELVRYGVRAANDPLIERSVRVVDQVLKVVTPSGTCWRRYNHDGYGQREDGEAYDKEDGEAYDKYGIGRAWPLLAGERGHFEIAAGRLPVEHIRSTEGFSTPTHLLPEQVWDEPDRPEAQHLRCGRPTGSAVPLVWAHAEYIKLLRSARDAKVYERVDEAAERYLGKRATPSARMVWSFNHPARARRAGETIRLIAEAAFEARWSHDRSKDVHTTRSTETKLGIHYADLDAVPAESAIVRFTFHWTAANRVEETHFTITNQR